MELEIHWLIAYFEWGIFYIGHSALNDIITMYLIKALKQYFWRLNMY